mgnify:CR=1 FL=1
MLVTVYYLLCKRIERGEVTISLAINCGTSTSTYGIHLPMSVVIVNHMEVPVSAPAILQIVSVLGFLYRMLEPEGVEWKNV